MKRFKLKSFMALSLSSFYAAWIYFLEKIFLYQKMPSLNSIITLPMVSGGGDFKFEATSYTTADISFQMKHSAFLNLK